LAGVPDTGVFSKARIISLAAPTKRLLARNSYEAMQKQVFARAVARGSYRVVV
jgi:hypothetical protein